MIVSFKRVFDIEGSPESFNLFPRSTWFALDGMDILVISILRDESEWSPSLLSEIDLFIGMFKLGTGILVISNFGGGLKWSLSVIL